MVAERLPSTADPSNPVMLSKPIADMAEQHRSMGHRLWCPGCDALHMPRSVIAGHTPIDGPHWGWNGSDTTPTFEPSYLTWWTTGPEHAEHRCHSFIRDGQWQFLGDCTHALAGQTVPLVPLPNWVVKEDY